MSSRDAYSAFVLHSSLNLFIASYGLKIVVSLANLLLEKLALIYKDLWGAWSFSVFFCYSV